MKKTIASFTVVVYFAFACGVMINYHYCMDRYDSFRLYTAASDWCSRCGMHTKDHGCCHDEVKIVKIQDDHQVTNNSFTLESLQPVIGIPSEYINDTSLSDGDGLNKPDHLPPLLSSPDIYIQNRVFRI